MDSPVKDLAPDGEDTQPMDEFVYDAESEGVQVQEETRELRCRKHRRMANKLYTSFWRHEDKEASDEGF